MSKQSKDIRIYLKNSDKVRFSDCRARIVRETNPSEPCDNVDLVFEKAESKDSIPENALYSWKFQPYGSECIWFFTTAERCKEMVSEDPSYWTLPKLKEFAEIEHRLYENWYNGNVYDIIIEKWDDMQREWTEIDSIWGIYGAKDVFNNLATETDGDNIPVCIDEETMKYDFDNTEKKVNEFK